MSVFHCGPFALDLRIPQVMGILNVTPDSFSDGGLYRDTKDAVEHAEKMLGEGAAIIDVGGESTRPGFTPVDEEEELSRVLPVLEKLAPKKAILSIDTSKTKVMQKALALGAAIVNDVRALEGEGALDVVSQTAAGVILMHSKEGRKEANIIECVNDYLKGRVEAVLQKGIALNRIVVDPGFGFAKSLEENFFLLEHLDEVTARFPTLIGLSRKSFVGVLSGENSPKQRDTASVALALEAARKGARILRVHDVKGTIAALKVTPV